MPVSIEFSTASAAFGEDDYRERPRMLDAKIAQS